MAGFADSTTLPNPENLFPSADPHALEAAMAHRRKKPSEISEAERDRLVAAATALHEACCAPLLDVRSEHYKALNDLNAQIVAALEVVTGEARPPWVSWRTSPGATPPK